MIVYHGSTMVIENPDVIHSKKFLDFGKGFYLTTFEKQAEKWANRKGNRQGKKGIVNVYDFSEKISNYKVLSFENENEAWLDFVCGCRRGENLNSSYDIVIGNVADDDVFKTVDLYFKGIWSKEKVLEELRYYKLNNQICVTNQKCLEDVLTFSSAYEVK